VDDLSVDYQLTIEWMNSSVNVDLIKLNWWKATEAQTKLDNDKEKKTNSEQRKRLKKEDNFERNDLNINIIVTLIRNTVTIPYLA
jgi:hypothetical protein